MSVLLCLQTSRSTSRLSQRSYNSHYLIDEYAESIDLDDSDDVTTSNRTETTGLLVLFIPTLCCLDLVSFETAEIFLLA